MALADDGRRAAAKVRTTPADLTVGLAAALRDLVREGVEPARTRLLVHGTTVATNAMLQGGLARVVLLSTAGFRDLLAIGTGARRSVYDLWATPQPALVPARDRLEVRERTGPRGEAIDKLSDAELRRVVDEVAARDPGSVAVSLLFAYASPLHERRLRDALTKRLPAVPVTISSDLSREFREYPRTLTTVVAAGLKPLVSAYLPGAAAAARAHGFVADLLVMRSSGGVSRPAHAAEAPHELILSGPAGGVTAAIAAGSRLGVRDLLSLDVGGTSADVCLVRDGVPPITASQLVEGERLSVSAVDITSAGAGGGSVAWMDLGGSLHVGPRSAGADPGPACYGLGGEEPTVTDAHLVAGDLDPDTPLAGSLHLDRGLAEQALKRVGAPLGLGTAATAAAILAVARARIGRTVRTISVERGIDPRGMTLVAFGGAGPLHAAVLQRELHLGQSVIPPEPGLASAEGLLRADLRFDASQTVLRQLPGALDQLLAWFREQAAALRAQLDGERVPRARQRLLAAVDCRYQGQGFELSVPLRSITPGELSRLARRFHATHAARYGHAAPDEPVEAVTLRLSAIGVLPAVETPRLARGQRNGRPQAGARRGVRPVHLPGMAEARPVTVWDRTALRSGDGLTGPCLIEQLDATTLVLPGMKARVEAGGDLRLRSARG